MFEDFKGYEVMIEYNLNDILNSNFDKKKSCILFFASSLLFIQQGVVLLNLQKVCNHTYDSIVIIEYDLTEDQKSFLLKIEPRIVFIHYTKDDLFTEFKLHSLNRLNYETTIPHVSTKYGRHLIFVLLKFFEKILMLEQDMIVQSDLSDIFNETGSAFSPMSDWYSQFKAMFQRNINDTTLCDKYKDGEKFYTTNCGLIYLDNNNKISENQLYDEVVSLKREMIHYIGGLDPAMDELIITYMLHKYSKNLRFLDPNIYNSLLHNSSINDNAKVIHALGYLKFWTNKYSLTFYPLWKECYNNWLELGGEKLTSVPEITRQQVYIDCMLLDCNYCILNTLNVIIQKIPNLSYNVNIRDFDKRIIQLLYLEKNLTINIVVNGYLGESAFYVVYEFTNKPFDQISLNSYIEKFNLSIIFDNYKMQSKLLYIKDFDKSFMKILNQISFTKEIFEYVVND